MVLDEERRKIVDELRKNIHLQRIAEINTKRIPRNAEASTKLRKSANELYVKKHHTAQEHEKIFILYTNSLVTAPHGSQEMALAYGNRSALLFHLGKYKECVQDIEEALKIPGLSSLKDKLIQRRAECLKYMSLSKKEANDAMTNDSLVIDSKIKTLTEKKDNISLVDVRYNDKYGRYLVATQDIKPGEIIFVQKPYAVSFNVRKPYLHCCHCLRIAWAGLPCDHCGWFIFCSQKCKEEAWMQYHDIECYSIPYICHFLNYIVEETKMPAQFDGLSIRTLVKGLKEMGSLEKLKAELQLVDECEDIRIKGFSNDGKFASNQFKSLYSLSNYISAEDMKSHIIFSSIVLICIAKYTSFFGENFTFTCLKELILNEDFVFVGSLLLKLSKINQINSHAISNVNDICKYSNDSATCRENWCCVRGMCIVPLASLTNHSCNPNASRCFSEDLNFILYAIQPIKKGNQICDNYNSNFYEASNPERFNMLKKNYYFECDCIACKKNWPIYPIISTRYEDLFNKIKMKSKEVRIWKKYLNLMASVEKENVSYSTQLLQNLSQAIEVSINSLEQPTGIMYKIIWALIKVFESIYGCKLQEFNNC